MNHATWYWIFRLMLGFGLMMGIMIGIVVTIGPAEIVEDMNEPATTGDFLAVIVGVIIGTMWDSVIAAGIASYVVWGKFMIGLPPLRYTEPRPMFQ